MLSWGIHAFAFSIKLIFVYCAMYVLTFQNLKQPLSSFLLSEAKPFTIDGAASAAHGLIDCVFSFQHRLDHS